MWLLLGGHAWDMTRYGDTINERVVRILLECILVSCVISDEIDKFLVIPFTGGTE